MSKPNIEECKKFKTSKHT